MLKVGYDLGGDGLALTAIRRGEIGSDAEHQAFNPEQDLGLGLGTRNHGGVGLDKTQMRVEFVKCAIGIDAGRVLGNPRAPHQRRGSVIAGACVDKTFFHSDKINGKLRIFVTSNS